MKLFWLLIAAGAALAGDLSQAHSVYLLPMKSGLDQYLADRLTQQHVLQVTTSPERADVVLTDRLGPAFEQKMTELYPPPPAPKPEPKPESAKADAKEEQPAAISGLVGDTVNKISAPASSFGGGKGTIFLVDVKTREVLWSTYEKPGAHVEKTAARVCEGLKKSLGNK